VEAADGKLLSADSRFIELAGDKHATATHLMEADIPTPLGLSFSAREPLPSSATYPAVLKPRDGTGSLGVRCVADIAAAHDHVAAHPEVKHWRIERFHPGIAASIAAFGGPRGWLLLPPGRQLLSTDGEFRYLGGEFPLEAPLAARAEDLARRALAALPPTQGYIGLDLVLGPAADGSQDAVIEVNPRLTTSYVGLRQLLRENLAEVWLAWLEGRAAAWHASERSVQFTATGQMLSSDVISDAPSPLAPG
jgi:predicted ATP-grasp superfamily ATP-dependent carboligase